jgi:glycogen synthase
MNEVATNLPSVSVVINTDGRAKALPLTLEGLRRLDYPNFEVCVVSGPTPDGTREFLQAYPHPIKIEHCGVRNLSESRNLGIRCASGEIIAFIDDDGVPEPEWLRELVAPFADPKVAAAGGIVYDHTGYELQYAYATCDRLGNADPSDGPASEFNFPYSGKFPYVQGVNSAFRRSAIIQLGGFDEEFEFYLDETDVCCRVIDAGYIIAQLPNARVHHKFLPSAIRNNDKVTVKKYPILKNKIYFSIVNNKGHHPMKVVIDDATRFVQRQREDLEYHFAHQRVTPDQLAQFEEDVDLAWRVGLSRGLTRERRTRPREWFGAGEAFRPLATPQPEGGRRTFVFLNQEYPPRVMAGGSRYTADIAREIAAQGHNVHVLTKDDEYNRVDLEEGVWVHRLHPRGHTPRLLPSGAEIPPHIWNHSATLLDEVIRISTHREVDAVEGISWDCETVAFTLDGRFPVATNVVTTLSHWLDTHPQLTNDDEWMSRFGTRMLELEPLVFDRSDMVIAASNAIEASIRERYEVWKGSNPVVLCQHGLADMSRLPSTPLPRLKAPSPTAVKFLFVGRLELRKGIDVLLDVAAEFLQEGIDVEFWIAGDKTHVTRDGQTEEEIFQAKVQDEAALRRIHFLGSVSEGELRWLYSNCDVLVVPSRFESFGLIFIEAMMFEKPVIGCKAGGMEEVITDGETGLLVAPGDRDELAAAMRRLAVDGALRRKIGRRGRSRYEKTFSAAALAGRRVELLTSLARRNISPDKFITSGEVRWVELSAHTFGVLLGEGAALGFKASCSEAFISFFCHDWSGLAAIEIDGVEIAREDLFQASPQIRTVNVKLRTGASTVTVRRTGQKQEQSNASEVIIVCAKER